MKEKLESKISNIKDNIMTILALSFMYILFVPIELYYLQNSNFSFSFNDIIILLLMCFLLLIIILLLLCLLINKKSESLLSGILFGFLTSSYIQYLAINRFYSSTETNYFIICIDVIITAGLIIGSIFINKKIKKYISTIILFTQLITAVTVVMQNQNIVNNHDELYCLDGSEQYNVSTDSNVIIFILDSYSNDAFEKAIEDNPKLTESLSDFTYYNNCNGGYDRSYIGINCLLSGQPYDGTIRIDEWFENIWNNEKTNNFYNTLKENNYDINFYTDANSAEFDLEKMSKYFDNIKQLTEDNKQINRLKATKLLLKLSSYQLTSIICKDSFYVIPEEYSNIVNNGTTIDHTCSDFYNKLNSGLTPTENKKFIVYHLEGLHETATALQIHYPVNENCEKAIEKDKINCAKGNLVMIQRYIEQLKNNSVYDNSTIIITADHGVRRAYEEVQPLFLIKTPNQKQENMNINSSPIDHKDLFATILDVLNIENDEYKLSIFDQKETDIRERKYQFVIYDKKYKNAYRYKSNVPCKDNIIVEINYTGNREDIIKNFNMGKYTIFELLEGMW